MVSNSQSVTLYTKFVYKNLEMLLVCFIYRNRGKVTNLLIPGLSDSLSGFQCVDDLLLRVKPGLRQTKISRNM